MLKSELDFLGQAENYANAYKIVIALILVHLRRGDQIAADKIYKAALS